MAFYYIGILKTGKCINRVHSFFQNQTLKHEIIDVLKVFSGSEAHVLAPENFWASMTPRAEGEKENLHLSFSPCYHLVILLVLQRLPSLPHPLDPLKFTVTLMPK